MNNMDIHTSVVRLSTPIADEEIPHLRGAIIHIAENAPLFHNHVSDGYRYSYPLIQYKKIGNEVVIVGVGEGVEALDGIFSVRSHAVRLGKRFTLLKVAQIGKAVTAVQLTDDASIVYKIRKYLPFNQENYAQYCKMDSIVDQYQFIEKCLVGNILSFAKGMGLFFGSEVKVKLMSVDRTELCMVKNVRMQGFDLTFKTNVLLPNLIGLGKSVSLGHGTIAMAHSPATK